MLKKLIKQTAFALIFTSVAFAQSNVGEDWTNSSKNFSTSGTLASGAQTVTGISTLNGNVAITGNLTVTGTMPTLANQTYNYGSANAQDTTVLAKLQIQSVADSDFDTLENATIDIGAVNSTRLYICNDNVFSDGTTATITSNIIVDFSCGGTIDGTAGGATETLTINGAVIIPDGFTPYGANLTVAQTSDINIGVTGVNLSDDGDGAWTWLGQGNGSDEDLTWNLDDTANEVQVSSSTGVTVVDFGTINLETDEVEADTGTITTVASTTGNITTINGATNTTETVNIGADGVAITNDSDGAITFTGLGDGADEDLTLNLDDTVNTVVVTSSTGVTAIDLGGITTTNSVGYKSTANEGTEGAGTITTAEYGNGYNHVTVLTLTDVVLPAISGAVDEAQGALIYTFPAGTQVINSIYMSVGISGLAAIQADTPDVGIGSVIASGAVATLDGTATFEDYVTGQTATDCNGTATIKATLTTSGTPTLLESGDTKTIYFNFADGWAGASATNTADGTVTIEWATLN